MSEHVHRALIVEDEEPIVDDVKDRLESLGHTCDCAATQAEAREFLAESKYCYILLDLQIPVRAKRMPHIDSGQNLLEEIRRGGINRKTQIIIMTSHGTDGYDLAVEMMQKGANDYVGKPFASGSSPRSLTCRIKKALERSCERPPCESVASADAATAQRPREEHTTGLKPFQGGELVFYRKRVELMGKQILGPGGKGISRRILEALAEKRESKGAYSGEDLARMIRPGAGQNDVAAAIRNLRKAIERALAEAGFSCDLRDVIDSGGSGYRFKGWITIRHADKQG